MTLIPALALIVIGAGLTQSMYGWGYRAGLARSVAALQLLRSQMDDLTTPQAAAITATIEDLEPSDAE